MIYWSHENFAEFSWSGRRERQLPSDRFELSYGPCRQEPRSFHEECLRAARLIGEAAGAEPISLMLSGGIDSEVMCRAFLEADVPFQAYSMRYQKPILADAFHAQDFCKQQGISLQWLDFDENHFLETELNRLAQEFKIHQPFAAFDIQRIKSVPGYFVFGAGDLVLEQKNGAITSYELGSFSLPRVYQIKHNRRGCYQFFQYTPELMLSFLLEPIMQHWLALAPRVGLENSRYWKTCLFRSIWPDITPRQKQTGYERFSVQYLQKEKELQTLYMYEQDQLAIPLNELLLQLDPGHALISPAHARPAIVSHIGL